MEMRNAELEHEIAELKKKLKKGGPPSKDKDGKDPDKVQP